MGSMQFFGPIMQTRDASGRKIILLLRNSHLHKQVPRTGPGIQVTIPGGDQVPVDVLNHTSVLPTKPLPAQAEVLDLDRITIST